VEGKESKTRDPSLLRIICFEAFFMGKTDNNQREVTSGPVNYMRPNDAPSACSWEAVRHDCHTRRAAGVLPSRPKESDDEGAQRGWHFSACS